MKRDELQCHLVIGEASSMGILGRDLFIEFSWGTRRLVSSAECERCGWNRGSPSRVLT